jgi:hypothetical protein
MIYHVVFLKIKKNKATNIRIQKGNKQTIGDEMVVFAVFNCRILRRRSGRLSRKRSR